MPATRRERYRQQTTDEIKAAAMAQVVAGGETAVSLNGIAKTMAMSPGALYRYFDNRDDLLAELVVDVYDDLAAHLRRVATGGEPTDRLRAVARGYRDWALRNPNAYRLVFETGSGSGLTLAADRVVPAAQRSMDVFLEAITDAGVTSDLPVGERLAAEVEAWGRRGGHDHLPAATLALGLVLWTRLHGLVSLEIGRHLQATGVSGQLLFDAQVDQLLAGAAVGPG